MSLSDPRLRRAALLVSGAAAVHELRFALAPVRGGEGPGHAYLHAALPVVAVLVALAATGFVTRLVAPRRERGPRRTLAAEWLSDALVLLAAFVLQESAESALSAHGPIFAAGGWLAVPIALAVGLAVALLARGARVVVAAGARARGRTLRLAAPGLECLLLPLLAAQRVPSAPLRHLAARPPPGSLVVQ